MSFSEETSSHFISEMDEIIKESMVPMQGSASPYPNGASSSPMRRGMPNSAVPSFGKGGIVKHRKNGKIIRVAEAGDEAIVPLAKKEKAKRMAKAILKKVQK